MTMHQTASKQDWTAARLALLEKEKAFTRARDELSAARRALPWEKVETNYVFEGERGSVSARRPVRAARASSSSITSCSARTGRPAARAARSGPTISTRIVVHLNARDTNLVADLARADRTARRLPASAWAGASNGSPRSAIRSTTISRCRSRRRTQARGGNNYNFGTQPVSAARRRRASAFSREDGGAIYHTYSTYSRGLDMLNGAYHLLDLVPKGRDEEGLRYPMEWLRRRDEY